MEIITMINLVCRPCKSCFNIPKISITTDRYAVYGDLKCKCNTTLFDYALTSQYSINSRIVVLLNDWNSYFV